MNEDKHDTIIYGTRRLELMGEVREFPDTVPLSDLFGTEARCTYYTRIEGTDSEFTKHNYSLSTLKSVMHLLHQMLDSNIFDNCLEIYFNEVVTWGSASWGNIFSKEFYKLYVSHVPENQIFFDRLFIAFDDVYRDPDVNAGEYSKEYLLFYFLNASFNSFKDSDILLWTILDKLNLNGDIPFVFDLNIPKGFIPFIREFGVFGALSGSLRAIVSNAENYTDENLVEKYFYLTVDYSTKKNLDKTFLANDVLCPALNIMRNMILQFAKNYVLFLANKITKPQFEASKLAGYNQYLSLIESFNSHTVA